MDRGATKSISDFDEDEVIPCKVIELSNSIIRIDYCDEHTVVDTADQAEKEQSSSTVLQNHASQQLDVVDASVTTSPHVDSFSKGNIIENIINIVKNFPDKHPILTVGIGAVATIAMGKVIYTKSNQYGRTGHSLMNNETLNVTIKKMTDDVRKFDFRKSESVLKQLGYTVEKRVGLSSIDRQKRLQEIITSGKMSKEEICACIEKYVNIHKNQRTFMEAVGKWIEDLEYVKNIL